ncbi:hypothetical protein [Actinomadura flavalba]|uniref:hypothetical protein n=1 Tax=Actinomadura flavalba TaxID=1120938 RepID=UPI00036F304A|nr:hypothetical protein [Actinomadura flavalba]
MAIGVLWRLLADRRKSRALHALLILGWELDRRGWVTSLAAQPSALLWVSHTKDRSVGVPITAHETDTGEWIFAITDNELCRVHDPRTAAIPVAADLTPGFGTGA